MHVCECVCVFGLQGMADLGTGAARTTRFVELYLLSHGLCCALATFGCPPQAHFVHIKPSKPACCVPRWETGQAVARIVAFHSHHGVLPPSTSPSMDLHPWPSQLSIVQAASLLVGAQLDDCVGGPGVC